MKTTGGILAILLLAACADATVDFFFWDSYSGSGLKNPSLMSLATLGNGRDFRDGYELMPSGGPYAVPPYAEPGLMPPVVVPYWEEWVYIWARFNNEPSYLEVGPVNGIFIKINGAWAGQGDIAYYLCDNTFDQNIGKKRWDGDLNYFYSNPTTLVAVTAAGIANKPGDEPWNLYVGGNHRAFLLGAVKKPYGVMELSFEVSLVHYAGTPNNPNPASPEIRYLNKVLVPEPSGLILLAGIGLAARRR